jgi:hypothetical protein
VDASAVSSGDFKETQSLLELIIGAVVQLPAHYDHKATIIRKMQTLNPDDQKELIGMIEKVRKFCQSRDQLLSMYFFLHSIDHVKTTSSTCC